MNLAILLATYNGEMFLAEQLDSLFSQTYTDFVIYAHDDGSIDRTVEILQQYHNEYPGKLIVLEYERTGGARNNFYSLMQRVDADYYMFCDQDDVWLPNKIEKSIAALHELEEKYQNEPCLIFTDLCVVNQNLTIVADSYMKRFHYTPEHQTIGTILSGGIVAGCTMAINRRCIDLVRINVKDINLYSMHDTMVFLLAIACGYVGYVDIQPILYRQHDNNTAGLWDKLYFNKWLVSKIKNFLHGQQIEKSMILINWQRKMIKALSEVDVTHLEQRYEINELQRILTSNKMERIKLYRKYKLLKNDWKNKWKIILV